MGLAVGEVAPGDVDVEDVEQRRAGGDARRVDAVLGREAVEPDPAQEQVGVLRRRGGRQQPGLFTSMTSRRASS